MSCNHFAAGESFLDVDENKVSVKHNKVKCDKTRYTCTVGSPKEEDGMVHAPCPQSA